MELEKQLYISLCKVYRICHPAGERAVLSQKD